MSVGMWADGIRTELSTSTSLTLISTISRLSSKSGIGGIFSLIFVDDLLFNAFGKSGGVGKLVRDVIGSHFGANIIGFAFESSEHSEHEENVFSGYGLSVDTSAEVLHAIGGRLPCSDVFQV